MKDEITKAGCGAITAEDMILYLYGELRDARFDEHIAACAVCRAELDGLRSARETARRSVDLPGETTVNRVKSAARRPSPHRIPRSWTALASSIVLAAALFLLLKTDDSRPPSQENREYLAGVDYELNDIEKSVAEDNGIVDIIDWFNDDSVDNLEVAASSLERDMDILDDDDIQSTDR